MRMWWHDDGHDVGHLSGPALGCSAIAANTCSPMSRRYEEIQAKAERQLAEAKAALKRLPDPARAHILRWLCKYYEDSGAMRSPQVGKQRRAIMIDGIEYWLVCAPKRRSR